MDDLYHSFYSTSYPSTFLPDRWRETCHIDQNQQTVNYNMGQFYLANAFAWSLLIWNRNDYTYVPFNRMDPDSIMVPVFNNPLAQPEGIQQPQNILGAGKKKYALMIEHALKEAIAAPDGFGVVGKALPSFVYLPR